MSRTYDDRPMPEEFTPGTEERKWWDAGFVKTKHGEYVCRRCGSTVKNSDEWTGADPRDQHRDFHDQLEAR